MQQNSHHRAATPLPILSAFLGITVCACADNEITPPAGPDSPDTVVSSLRVESSTVPIIGVLSTTPFWIGAAAVAENGEVLYGSTLNPGRFSWSSSAPDVATVDTFDDGLRAVRGLSEGTATITATSQGLTDSILITVWDRARPAWSVGTGSGWANADIAIGGDGTIYVGTNYPAGDRSHWSAISPQGGTLWAIDLPTTANSIPAIGEDGTLYFGSMSTAAGGFAGRLIAVGSDGNEQWTLEGIDGIRSSPAIGPGGIIHVAGGRHLYAVTPQGELLWSYEAGDEVFFLSSPAVASDGSIYVGAEDHRLYALHPDGSLRWTFLTADRIRSSPSIGQDGTIHIGSHDGRLYAINPDGTERWSLPLRCGLDWGCEPVESTPSIGADGTIYVAADGVYAIDPGGAILWRYPHGAGTPIVGSDGTVYQRGISPGPSRDAIHAIDADGQLLWAYPTEELIGGSPAIGNDGTIFWASSSGSSPASADASGTVHAIVETVSTNGGYSASPWPTARRDRGNTGRSGG